MVDETTPDETTSDTVPMSADNWLDFIPEDLKEDPSITKYTDFGAFVKGHVNAVGMIGKDKLVLPETDDQWSDTFDKLGRPGAANEYGLTVPEGVTDEQKFDDAFSETLGTTLHGLGLSTKQAQGVSDFMYSTVATASENTSAVDTEMAAAAATELRKEYGSQVDARIDASMRVVSELGGEGAGDQISKEDLALNPILVKVLSSIADKVLEETGLDGGDQGATRTDLQEQITETMSNPAYTDRKHIEHTSAVEKVFALRQRLHAAAA